jgi:hypothetical protein
MRVNPYLLFNGNCEEAFGAYAKILGGKIVGMMPFEGSPAGEKTPADWRKKIPARPPGIWRQCADGLGRATGPVSEDARHFGDAQCR